MFKLLLSILIWPISSMASTDCQISQTASGHQLNCPQMAIEQQNVDAVTKQMTVLFNDGFSMELVLEQNEGEITPHFAFDAGQRQKESLTLNDQQQLHELAIDLENNGLAANFGLLSFFENIPTNESLKPLIKATGEVPWPQPASCDAGEVPWPKECGESGEVPWPKKKDNGPSGKKL